MTHFLRLSSALIASFGMAVFFTGCVASQDESAGMDGASLRQNGQSNPDQSSTPQSATQGAGTIKVDICHVPPGNPANIQYITVGSPSYDAHLAHGDLACSEIEDDSEEQTPTQDPTDVSGSGDTGNGGTSGTDNSSETDEVIDPTT